MNGFDSDQINVRIDSICNTGEQGTTQQIVDGQIRFRKNFYIFKSSLFIFKAILVNYVQ